MKKIAVVFLTLLLPTVLSAAEVKIKGTILKVNKVENRFVLKTERGEETFETTKTTKGIENAKEGAKVTVVFSEKDGLPKVSELIRD